jgi:hypothetical protein
MEMRADPKRKPSQRDRIAAERARQHQEEALDDALKNTPSSEVASYRQTGRVEVVRRSLADGHLAA